MTAYNYDDDDVSKIQITPKINNKKKKKLKLMNESFMKTQFNQEMQLSSLKFSQQYSVEKNID